MTDIIKLYCSTLINIFNKLTIDNEPLDIFHSNALPEYITNRNFWMSISPKQNVAVLSLDAVTYDPTRYKTPKNKKVYGERVNNNKIEGFYIENPAPFNFDFTLAIKTRSINDIYRLVETIGSAFSPGRHIVVKEFGTDETRLLLLSDISMDSEVDAEFNTEVNTVSFAFTLFGYLYSSVKEAKFIENVSLGTKL